jgi:hypothetical protein
VVRNDAELKAFRDRWMARKNGILTQINDLWLKALPRMRSGKPESASTIEGADYRNWSRERGWRR